MEDATCIIPASDGKLVLSFYNLIGATSFSLRLDCLFFRAQQGYEPGQRTVVLQRDSLAAANGKKALSNDALLAFVVTALEKFEDAGMRSVDPLLVVSFFEQFNFEGPKEADLSASSSAGESKQAHPSRHA